MYYVILADPTPNQFPVTTPVLTGLNAIDSKFTIIRGVTISLSAIAPAVVAG